MARKYDIGQLRGSWGAGYAAAKRDGVVPALVGQWFHSFHEDGGLNWQGQVVGVATDGSFLVQLYEWLTGYPSEQRVVPYSDMLKWTFYQTNNQMNAAYDRYEASGQNNP